MDKRIKLAAAAAAACALVLAPVKTGLAGVPPIGDETFAPADTVPAGEAAEEETAAASPTSSDRSSTSDAVVGTAVLVGAGAFTYTRSKWKENREKQENQEYVYFENHTKNGTLKDEERNQL